MSRGGVPSPPAPASSSRIALLLRNLDEAYERKAWHGPNLRGSLRGVDRDEASWRPARGRHNVWELALHAAYWKYAVRRRLTGEKRGSFEIEGSNWFERPARGSEADWRGVLALLDREHRALRAEAERISDRSLDASSAGSKQTNATLLAGIAAHDVYHAGQIQLVKALYRHRRGRRAGRKR